MSEKAIEGNDDVRKTLKALSSQDFKNFGLHQIAYIKAIKNETKQGYAIYNADGEKLSVTDTIEKAAVIARQNDLEPVIVH